MDRPSDAAYSSAIVRATRCRPVVMQIWPWWMNEPKAPDRDRLLEVDVVEHDQRRVAAELEVDPLEVLRRERADDPAGPGRAGERDAARRAGR